MPMRIFSHRHENFFSWARESRLFVTPRGRTRAGVLAYTVNPDPFFPPRTNILLVVQEVFLMGTKREFHSAGFVFSRLTAAACVLPAGNKVHRPDSSLPTAIFRFTLKSQLKSGSQEVSFGLSRRNGDPVAPERRPRCAGTATPCAGTVTPSRRNGDPRRAGTTARCRRGCNCLACRVHRRASGFKEAIS